MILRPLFCCNSLIPASSLVTCLSGTPVRQCTSRGSQDARVLWRHDAGLMEVVRFFPCVATACMAAAQACMEVALDRLATAHLDLVAEAARLEAWAVLTAVLAAGMPIAQS